MTKKERNYLNTHFFKVEIREKATDMKFIFYINMNYILAWLKVYNGEYEMRIYDIYDPIKKNETQSTLKREPSHTTTKKKRLRIYEENER